MLPIIRIRRARRKIGSFGFACVSACGWGKAKCAPDVYRDGLAEFQIFCAVGKKLKHEAVGCCVSKRSTRWSVFVTLFLMSNDQV
jgi:hypothetical protein